MQISNAKRLIKSIVRSDIVHAPILLVGGKGIGKTEIVEQVCKELSAEFDEDFGFVDLRLSTKEPAEISGYPYRTTIKTPYGKREAMAYALPYWFPSEGTRGIIFLDELNRSHVDVRHGIMQIVHERRLEDNKVPKGWHIIGAMNPPDTGEYQVEELDVALQRRFSVIKVIPEFESWLNWAKKNNITSKTTSFLIAQPSLFNKEEKFTVRQDFSADQWTRVDRAVFAIAPNGESLIPPDLIPEFVAGLVGAEAAIPYVKWIEKGFKRPVTGKQILDGYDSDISQRLAQQKNDQDFITMAELIAEIKANDNPTDIRVKNLVQFIIDSKAEMKATLGSRLPPNYSRKLMTNKSVTAALASVTRGI